MLDTHAAHTATLLANGKVLVVDHGTNSTAAELYDPVAGTGQRPVRRHRYIPVTLLRY